MCEKTQLSYYKKNRDMILSKSIDKYCNLSEEEKIKKREYAKNRLHNMSKEGKDKGNERAKNRYHNASEEQKAKRR